jgi:arylsulfatase A-like enzyme
METIDEEVTEHAAAFIDRCHKNGKPFFLWYNTTAMHFRTHRAEKHKGMSGPGEYNDIMVAHDENIGRMLARSRPHSTSTRCSATSRRRPAAAIAKPASRHLVEDRT